MPGLDKPHHAVVRALEKDGWTITGNPLRLRYSDDNLVVDLAAEQVIAAEQGTRKIAVEIKTFSGASEMRDLHNAVGQFIVYRRVLAAVEPERELYLAVPEKVREQVFDEGVAALLFKTDIQRMVTFDEVKEEIVKWLP